MKASYAALQALGLQRAPRRKPDNAGFRQSETKKSRTKKLCGFYSPACMVHRANRTL
jgi:hypothetical protein